MRLVVRVLGRKGEVEEVAKDEEEMYDRKESEKEKETRCLDPFVWVCRS